MAEPNLGASVDAGGDWRNGLPENNPGTLAAGDNGITNQQQSDDGPAAAQSLCQMIAQPAAGDGPAVVRLEKDANANEREAEANNNGSDAVLKLREEISRTSERDEFRKKLEEAERKLSSPPKLEATMGEQSLRRELEDLRGALAQTKLSLDERERRVASQDDQIAALMKQVSSLKEVVAITKDMLSIRNMEVKHLQDDVDKMESRIGAERDRHNEMINKMDAAVKLNADLKKEYQTQLKLFQDLRGKYEEKVMLLSEENRALESAVQAQPAR